MKKRLVIISFFVIIFIAFITIWNFSYREGLEEAYTPIIEAPSGKVIPLESGMFKRSDFSTDYVNLPVDEDHQRFLKDYYNNRAFLGAPPTIPHPVANDHSVGGNTCIQCHQDGGFVEKYNAYAPITPHPEMINCRQCHVEKKTDATFKPFAFNKETPPKVGVGVNNALIGTPPMIPHQLEMRESCISCHAGPSAPKEIRTTHPERINCRQCHLPKTNEAPIMDESAFKRSFKTTDEK
ncbi:cytochrome C [Formosa haliotis]|uniref:cytochrome C n=1 Tax=Formosa haliotis TaxID=1555194 RepID=UPI0008260478|nr:cytochrome C [Formosa haliotis]